MKPEFWLNEDLAGVSYQSRLMAIALLNHSDDEGYFKANPLLVKSACFPLDEDSSIVQRTFDELSGIDYIRLFTGTDGKQYGVVVQFNTHQRVDRPTASKIRPMMPSDFDRGSDDQSPLKGKGSNTDEPDTNHELLRELLDYLNTQAGKNFKPTPSNLKFIRGRLSEKHSPDDIRAVVDRKVKEWANDSKMAQYLRPATVFGAEKFNQYVGELSTPLPGENHETNGRPRSRSDRHAASLTRSRDRVDK